MLYAFATLRAQSIEELRFELFVYLETAGALRLSATLLAIADAVIEQWRLWRRQRHLGGKALSTVESGHSL